MLGNSPIGADYLGSRASSPTPLEALVEEEGEEREREPEPGPGHVRVEKRERQRDANAPIPALFGALGGRAGAVGSAGEGAGEGESPLQEKPVKANVNAAATTAKGRLLHLSEPKRFTALEKGKGKAEVVAATTMARPRSAPGEKENDVKVSSSKAGSKGSVTKAAGKAGVRSVVKTSTGKGGARRVAVDSAEAPFQSGRGWRG